jgi:hypothetical protein
MVQPVTAADLAAAANAGAGDLEGRGMHLTGEPYRTALHWVRAHPRRPIVPDVAGEQARLEHDILTALIAAGRGPPAVAST